MKVLAATPTAVSINVFLNWRPLTQSIANREAAEAYATSLNRIIRALRHGHPSIGAKGRDKMAADMPDGQLGALAAGIVASYVQRNTVPIAEIGALITLVQQTLSALGRAEAVTQSPLIPAVPIRNSVRPDYVVCLDCGFRAVMLRRHLNSKHGLTPEAYRARWGLPLDHPVTAPNHSKHRSDVAKQIGLGFRRSANIGVAGDKELSAEAAQTANETVSEAPARTFRSD